MNIYIVINMYMYIYVYVNLLAFLAKQENGAIAPEQI